MTTDDANEKPPVDAAKLKAENSAFLKEAMAADAEIDQLTGMIQEQLKRRSKALENLSARGVKRFAWQGLQLTIWRKGDGLFSLRGKKKDDSNVFSID